MADQQGSSLPRFKTALTAALQARVSNTAAYESPSDASELYGADGSGQGVWWLDNTEAELIVPTFQAAPQWFDEVAHPVLVIQCIGIDTSDTQSVLDTRATNLLGHALAILASDASVGLALNGDTRLIRATPESWTYTTGVDSQNQRGARYELRLMLEARVTVEATT